MRKILCILMLSLSMLTANAQYASLNSKEIKQLVKAIKKDSKGYDRLLQARNKALTDNPNPIQSVLSEGLLAGNPIKTATLKAVEDAYKVYALAMVYSVGHEKADLAKATEFLLAWAKINKANGNPINETKLEDMITGYDLLRKAVNPAQRDTIDKWMKSIADAEVNSKYAKGDRGTAINNWNSHRIKIITLIAYTLHDKSYDSIITTELEKQLAVNLNPDGTTWDLAERDAFHYQIYDIEPLLSACIAIYKANGKNYFTYQTPNGSSIKKCVDYMVPFTTGEKTHGEFVNSKVPFDKQRAKNNEKGYAPGTLFEPATALHLFSLAAYFDDSYLEVIKKASKEEKQDSNWQLMLNSAMKAAKR